LLLLEIHNHGPHGTEGFRVLLASPWAAKLARLPVPWKSESLCFADCPAQGSGAQMLQVIKSPVVMAALAALK